MNCILAVILSVLFAALMSYLIYVLCSKKNGGGNGGGGGGGGGGENISDGVVEIKGEKQFNKIIKQNRKVIVMFWAPWCGHCQSTKPKVIKAAEIIHREGHAVVVMVNGDEKSNESLMKKYEVRGFPTFLKFVQGEEKWVAYSGDRSVDSFCEFAQKK